MENKAGSSTIKNKDPDWVRAPKASGVSAAPVQLHVPPLSASISGFTARMYASVRNLRTLLDIYSKSTIMHYIPESASSMFSIPVF